MPQAALADAGFRVDADVEAYEPKGCTRCGRTGYKGRVGLYSVMAMSERDQGAHDRARLRGRDRDVALEQGMLTLREDGLDKVRMGITSIAGGRAGSR